jgi:hypothetical protein
MNDTFSLKRFGLLLKKTIIERPTQTIGVTVLLLILSLTLYIFAKNIFGFHTAQNLTFVWGLTGGGLFLASFVFNYFNHYCPTKIGLKTAVTLCGKGIQA